MIPDRKITRALVVVAHPDDVDFWAGGTVASATSAGIAVAYCVFTDGDSGGFGPAFLDRPSPTSAEMSRRRPLLSLASMTCGSLGSGVVTPCTVAVSAEFRAVDARGRAGIAARHGSPRNSA